MKFKRIIVERYKESNCIERAFNIQNIPFDKSYYKMTFQELVKLLTKLKLTKYELKVSDNLEDVCKNKKGFILFKNHITAFHNNVIYDTINPLIFNTPLIVFTFEDNKEVKKVAKKKKKETT